MTSPLPLPDWMPWWTHLVLLLAILFFGLMLLLMPFSVFGIKSRLDAIEARLDELQGEIRSLALRLPETPFREPDDEVRLRGPVRPGRPDAGPYAGGAYPGAPFPPPPVVPKSEAARGNRTEPRLY